jgi:hypothetical protein
MRFFKKIPEKKASSDADVIEKRVFFSSKNISTNM